MRIEIVHNDPSREQSKEPRCELEHSKDNRQKTDSELTEVNRITLPGQRLNGYEFHWHGAEERRLCVGIAVTQATSHNAAEIERAISAIGRPGGALIVLPAPVFASNRELIARLAALHKLPAVYPYRYYATVGGLMSYGMDAVDIFRRASLYVDRLLKGESPSHLPIQAPIKFELLINLKTAKAIGIAIPPTLLARADQVIE
jgi:putative ABC transport system substrate-binding protein